MLTGGYRGKETQKYWTSDKPLFSVVTVVFNGEKTVEDTIRSVIGQKYDSVEYIIIDGGSTDGTLDIIRKYEDKIAYWISEPDRGIYDAMNKGVAQASGKWIHMLNADDYYVSDDVLGEIAPVLSDEKHFYYFTLLFNAEGKITKQKFHFNKLNFLKLFYSAYIPQPTMFVSKSQFNAVGAFDLNFKIASDHDMILRLCRRFPPFFFDIDCTMMRSGGYSEKNILRGFAEFRDIVIKQGLPPSVANLLYRFKVWKFQHKHRQ